MHLISIPLSGLNDSPPLCMHLIIWCYVYFVCVLVKKCVWAKSVDTLITSSLSSETGADATGVTCSFDCCFTRDPEIAFICTFITDMHVCVLFILLSLLPRPRELMRQITVRRFMIFIFHPVFVYICACNFLITVTAPE